MTQTRRKSLLLVNYHYVRDRSQYPYPGVHPIAKRDFVEQVNWLVKHYYMASPEEVEAYCHGESALPGQSVFLTFDDGLVDHVEIAREILDPLRITAAFFVCSRPIVERKAITVHKVHWLRATTEPEWFRTELEGLLPKEWTDMVQQKHCPPEAAETYPYDTLENARIKYLINFHLPPDVVDDITSEMLRRRAISEDVFCGGLYMNQEQLSELAQAGHIIGSHGHTHTPFRCLSEDLLDREIKINLDCIETITGAKPRWVSYPCGSQWAIPDDPEGFCQRFGFSLGLTLYRGWNDSTQSPWALNRINTNDVPKVV